MQAYDQLQVEGFVHTQVGAGTFVADTLTLPERTVFRPGLAEWGQEVTRQSRQRGRGSFLQRPRPGNSQIDFGFGRSFPHIFPYAVWRRLLARYLSTDDVMLSRYGSVAGFTPLREAVAKYLVQMRGVRCQPEQVVIVSGAQQALDIIGRLLLSAGDSVLVETPGYTDAYALFTTQGATLCPLPVDQHGCVVEAIPAGQTARLAFVTPANQFPQGGTLPAGRRVALLRWARQVGALIIEDDYDGELRYDARPVAALQGLDRDGRVVYLGSFSKVLFPALRLGYLVLPSNLLGPFLKAKRVVDRGAPTLTQAAVADFITEGHFERHLRRLRKEYSRRRAAFVATLETHLPEVQFSTEPAGLHIMLYLPAEVDEKEAIRQAAQAGVRVYPGAPYHVPDPAETNGPPPSILMGFTGLEVDQIIEGVRCLGQAWQPLLN
jgi:GntR family transcriptional regulator/MocR family aminotransferase